MERVEEAAGTRLPDLPLWDLLWQALEICHLSWLAKEAPEDFYQEYTLFLLEVKGLTVTTREEFEDFVRRARRRFYAFARNLGYHRPPPGHHDPQKSWGPHRPNMKRRELFFGDLSIGTEPIEELLTEEKLVHQSRQVECVDVQKKPAKTRKYHYKEEELIGQLLTLKSELGRSPDKNDVTRMYKKGRCAAYSSFIRRFGSWAAALEAAGMKKLRKWHRK